MQTEIDPYVQEMVAGTNGNMYQKVIGKLKSYPIPDFPIRAGRRRLLLEIGCGWGRWMVSAGRAGFIPIGIDIKVEAALAAKRLLESHSLKGFCVVADLALLPFISDSFDTVWSYSVVQHVHRTKAHECIGEVYRVLKPGTRCLIEFPIAHGIGNCLRLRPNLKEEDDPDSWCVRYYSIKGLAELFESVFGNFDFQSHCYFGIGIQSIDLKYVPWRFKPVIISSLFLTRLSRKIPTVKYFSDSVYVQATKRPHREYQPADAPPHSFEDFVKMLKCPISGEPLSFDSRCNLLRSAISEITYPVISEVPVLTRAAAQKR